MTMGCTPSSHSSDQTGFAYGCAQSSHSSGNEHDYRRTSIELNGNHTTTVCNNKEMRESLVLLVFDKPDAQCDALKWAAEKLSFETYLCHNFESAVDCYTEERHHLVIIDSRHSSHMLDASSLCRSIRNIKGSEYTCIVAVVKRSLAEKEEAGVLPFIRHGFNRWFIESYNLGICLNELIQLENNDIAIQSKLKASHALFTALDYCKDGVIVTGPNHDIQYLNQAIEKMLGFRYEEIIGKNAYDLHRSDSLKTDVVDSINMHINKGKEWEGTIFHRRKSGECIPLWSKISPLEVHNGIAEHLVFIKEFPYYSIEKMFSPDGDVLPYTYGSIKSTRKASYDVKSLCSDVGLGRRQSFAKFHAMTIEAPITKVINILMATQENSPVFVAQALDKVLEILKNSELYSPQFPNKESKPDDQMASDLVSGLMSSGTKQSGVRRMSHEAASNKSSVGGGGVTPQTPTQLPSLSNVPNNIKNLLDKDSDWGFDIIELERVSQKRPLVWLGLSVLSSFDVCRTLNCDEITLRNWLTVIEANYRDNPYHNSTHAADVMQATAYFLRKPRLKTLFYPLDEAICLIAAIIHDVDHPGKNSAFLCNSNDEMAILYNDISVLESHHAAHAFHLTVGPNSDPINIFKNLDSETYRDVRQSIIDMVLATEMTKHFEHLSKFVHVFTKSVSIEEGLIGNVGQSGPGELETVPESPNMITFSTPENIVLIKRILIKCADVSNPARPLDLCKVWAHRIAEEYCNQTDEEKRQKLPVVMPTFDRLTCSIPKSQIGFIDYFANDMFDAWDSFGDFPEIAEHLRSNYHFWKELSEQNSNKDIDNNNKDKERQS
ncbi:high affinity cAMP-specific and IBMX-insensitive 3',5'-cyclic phosphodiesterase 8B-like isoform X2 [Oppia nitens]|uniref:high affinity cAMP-specific and IBMX-insensitive 3',5'-cyclic phosphodiesterase 8B-like isoform X2 n=1 Tax=Oppia nitens TaxID=1686743 RepID=UPI0023DCA136|nr:high affinity cAMP-specific and IBMX-insensitive 3',5'-cyclic phosphodiesterase 8B-like isoform X2 [Oppia nitens]